ncbi:hypothetical protein NS115_01685 [Paenibacillus jamilae]|uniref:Uncharacterized protein n=1 Tax=Paenibacillus jamilae TaxID=114136 RepID=A0ACC5A1P0_9BACL|nr:MULTISPECIES: hypothetical protein [Paenibacillus]AUO08173.1 hypothetical protein C0638_17305 [Paenibacillus sp. lzh-N1]KTS85028.1 hypothetical protein NS115_01685 [Paenibacillus jamilae]
MGIILDILKDVVIAIITGIGTGWVMTEYYREKDKRTSWIKQFEEEKQIMSYFLRQVYFEIDLFKDNSNYDKTNLLRVLKTAPRFSSLSEVHNKELFVNDVITLNLLLRELEDYLTASETINYNELVRLKSEIFKAHFQVLKMPSSSLYGR